MHDGHPLKTLASNMERTSTWSQGRRMETLLVKNDQVSTEPLDYKVLGTEKKHTDNDKEKKVARHSYQIYYGVYGIYGHTRTG